MEKPGALTIFRQNVINYANIRTPGQLPCQPESAVSGQVVCFFHTGPLKEVKVQTTQLGALKKELKIGIRIYITKDTIPPGYRVYGIRGTN